MGFSLDKNAPSVNRVDNDILFFLSTDNLYTGSGSPEIMVIQYDSDPIEDETMTIELSNLGTIVFTFKDSPDDSGFQIPTRGATPLADWMDDLKNYINRNYILYTYFDITVLYLGAWNLVFIGRNYNSYANIDSYACDSGRFNNIILTDGEDAAKRENYESVLQVWLKNGSDFLLAGEERISPGIDLKARYNISDYIKPYIRLKFNYDPSTYSQIFNWTEALRHFHVKYGEAYGNPTIVYGMSVTDDMICLPGMIHKTDFLEKYIKHDADWSTFRGEFNNLNEFLTNQPAIKTIRKDDPEKLFLPFIAGEEGNEGVKVKYLLYYTDNTADTKTITSTFNEDCIIEINTDVKNNLLEWTNPSKEIKKYDVWVERPDGTVISNTQTYVVDFSSYHHDHLLFFRNRKGGFEPVRLTGVKNIQTEYDKDVISQASSVENPMERRKKYSDNIDKEDIIKINTGHKTKEEIDWISELLESDEEGVYEVINDVLIPIYIDKQTVTKFENKNFVYNLSFEYRRSQNGINVEKRPIFIEDNFDSSGSWQKKKEDLTTNNPDLTWYNDDPITAYKFTSDTTLVAVLMYPVGIGLLLSGHKYRIEIDVENDGADEIRVTPFITGIEGTTVTVVSERKTIIQEFIAVPSELSDIMVKVRNPGGVPDSRTLLIYGIKIRKCLE